MRPHPVARRVVVPGPRHAGRRASRYVALVHDEAAVLRREALLAFRDLGAELVRIDDVLVHLKERHVVVERLVQQDHELDQVRARLLPERLLAAPKRLVMSVAMP